MADKCLKCSEVLEDLQVAAKCSDCSGLFHPACCGKSVDAVRKLRSGSRKWRCDACKGESTSSQSRSDAESSEPTSVIEMFKALRGDMASNMEESRRRFDGVDQSLGVVKATMEEFQDKMLKLEQDNKNLAERCDKQEESIVEAKKTIRQLQREVLDLQQYSRRSNLEFKGIPWQSKENVYFILECTARALDVPYNRGDISTAHRLPARGVSDIPVIIAAFVSRSTREMWLSAARVRRLNTSDVSPHLKQGPVYINPHLTGHNKALLGRAKRMAREGKLFSAWATDGKVMFRHKEKGSAQRVFDQEDLDRFDK